MQFERVSMYCKESKEGYLIAAVKVYGKWGYHASGPKRKCVRGSNCVVAVEDPIKGTIPYRIQYNIGDEMPSTREHLGCFHEDNYGGTDAARQQAEAACLRHYEQVQQLQAEQQDTIDAEQSRVLPSTSPCGALNPRDLASDRAESLPNT